MSSIGLPMLNGFVGELLILVGTFLASPLAGVLGAFGVVLAAAYMLWMYRRVFFGALEKAENRSLIDLGWRERAILLALLVPIFWIGIYPKPFLRRLDAATVEVLARVDLGRAQLAAARGPTRIASGDTP
jgi:NADH-quinone oxidoreductase subunit M